MSQQQLSLTSDTQLLHESDHEQNDNWEWSDDFTEFVHDRIDGFSLKICTGLRPICDVNLDIKRLDEVAESDEATFSIEPITDSDDDQLQAVHETLQDTADPGIVYGQVTADNPSDADLYNGVACSGDMFELPFKDNSFDTVVSDPPWLNLSTDERKSMFEEVVRVTKPAGNILYNATWVPTDEHTRQYDLRFRQQKDFWGGPSFIALHRRVARDVPELFEAHDYESVERYPKESSFWSEAYSPEALSTEHNTDPKLISGHPEHRAYCCPACGCSQLGHLRTPEFEAEDGRFPLYECHNCRFRVARPVVQRVAQALHEAAERRNVPVDELDHVEHTPKCIERRLEQLEVSPRTDDAVLSPDLPWVPCDRYAAATTR